MPLTSTLPTIRLKVSVDAWDSSAVLYIEFDLRLQHVGSDYKVYANTWPSSTKENETVVLQAILSRLFTDRSGVEWVAIKPFQLGIHGSKAVTRDEVIILVIQGINNAGFTAQPLD